MSHKVKITPLKRALSLLLAVMFVVSGLSLEVFAADMDSGDVEIISEDDGSNSVQVDAAEPEVVSGADVPQNEVQKVIDASTDEPICEGCENAIYPTGPPVEDNADTVADEPVCEACGESDDSGEHGYSVSLMLTNYGYSTFADTGLEGSRYFEPGDAVEIEAYTDEGYSVAQFAVTEEDGQTLVTSWSQVGANLSFIMPDYNVKVYVLFERGDENENVRVPLKDVITISDVMESDHDVMATKEYIFKNADSKYVNVGSVDDMTFADVLGNTITVYDDERLDDVSIGDIAADSLEEMVNGTETTEALSTQLESMSVLYDVDGQSDYYVGLFNVIKNDSKSKVTDVAFAYNNNDGEIVDDVVYDWDTGLVYVPKSYIPDDDSVSAVLRGQMTVLQDREENDDTWYMDVVIDSDSDATVSSGTARMDVYSSYFAVQLLKPDAVGTYPILYPDIEVYSDGLNMGKPLSPYADGAIKKEYEELWFDEDSYWTYDPYDGYLYFLDSAYLTSTLEVKVHTEGGILETGLGYTNPIDTQGWLALVPQLFQGGIRRDRIWSKLNKDPAYLGGPRTMDEMDITDMFGMINWYYAVKGSMLGKGGSTNGNLTTAQFNGIYDKYGYWQFDDIPVVGSKYKYICSYTTPDSYTKFTATNPVRVYYEGNAGRLPGNGSYGSADGYGGLYSYDAQRRIAGPYVALIGSTTSDNENTRVNSMHRIEAGSINDDVRYVLHGRSIETAFRVQMEGGTAAFTKPDGTKVNVKLPGAGWGGVSDNLNNGNSGLGARAEYNLCCAHIHYSAEPTYNPFAEEIASGLVPIYTSGAAKGNVKAYVDASNLWWVGAVKMTIMKVKTIKSDCDGAWGWAIIGMMSPRTATQTGVGFHKVLWKVKKPSTCTADEFPSTSGESDTPHLKLRLQKVDADGNALAGATFRLKDPKNRYVTIGGKSSWVVGDSGEIVLTLDEWIEKYPTAVTGTYTWVETKAPEGYTIKTAQTPVTVNPNVDEIGTLIDPFEAVSTVTNGDIITNPEFAPLCFYKVSKYPQISSCNPAYDFTGAKYKLSVKIDDEKLQKALGLGEPYILEEEADVMSDGKFCFKGIKYGALTDELKPSVYSEFVGYPIGASWTLTEITPPSYGYLINTETMTGVVTEAWQNGTTDPIPVYDDHEDEPFYDVDLELLKFDEKLYDVLDPDNPQYDIDSLNPVEDLLTIETTKSAQGDASLVGARFKFEFFAGENLTRAEVQAQRNSNSGPLFEFEMMTLSLGDHVGISFDLSDEFDLVPGSWKYNCAGATYKFDDFINRETGKFMWPIGTIAITEVSPPPGYKDGYRIGQYQDGKILTGPVDNDSLLVYVNNTTKANADSTDPIQYCLYPVTVEETTLVTGTPELWKHDFNRVVNKDGGNADELRDDYDMSVEDWTKMGQGDASLEGAEFEIINDSLKPIVINERTYPVGAVVGKMTTDATGHAKYDGEPLPYGTYIVREVKAPVGYSLGMGDEVLYDRDDVFGQFQALGEYFPGQTDSMTYTITYSGLEPNATYKISASLMCNGEEAVDYDGPIKFETQFVPASSDGQITKTFTYDAWVRFYGNGAGDYSIKFDRLDKVIPDAVTGFEYDNPVEVEGQLYADLNLQVLDEFTVNDMSWDMTGLKVALPDGATTGSAALKLVVDDDTDLSKLDVRSYSSGHGIYDILFESDKTPSFGKSPADEDDVVETEGVVDASSGSFKMTVYYGQYGHSTEFDVTVLKIGDLGKQDLSLLTAERDNSVDYNMWAARFEVRTDGEVVMVNSWNKNPVLEPIWRGGFKFLKVDAKTKLSEGEGDGDLKAKFGVFNRSKTDVFVNGSWYAPSETVPCFTFWTDADTGYFESSNDLLPYGSYVIKELEPSTGYLLNGGYRREFIVRENGKIYDLGPIPCEETPISGDVQLVKYDYDMQKSESMNGASLAGVKFELYNRSNHPVKYKGAMFAPGALMDTLTTHWNEEVKAYTAETLDNSLVYGTYGLKEIGYTDAKGNFVSTNGKYLVLDSGEALFQIRNDGEKVTYGWMRKVDSNTRPTVTDDDVITGTRYEELEKLYPKDSVDPDGYEKSFLRWFNKIPRGDIQFNKRAEDTQKGMKTAWLVTSIWNPHESVGTKPKDPEQHIIITDDNGRFDSNERKYEGIAHEWATNGNDYLLSRVLAGDSLILDPNAPNMDGYECGVWFGKGEFGTQTTQADNSQGAFPYGIYEFQEIRSDTNVGYGLAKFTVKVYQNGVTVEFGTVFDSATDIDTHAFDGKTGIQSGCASRDTLIYDEVSYAGLEAGRQYTLETFIVDAEDGSFFGYTDDEGNFVRFSSKTTFTPADTKGTQRTEIRFNGEGLVEGKTVTVYQYLYDAEDNLVAYHDYQDDKDEQVTYPLVHTTALSDLTKGHEVSTTEDGDVTVVDTVYFENLTPGYNYEVTGVAVDSLTGIEYPQITAKETFMPKESTGSVQLTFKFDATLLEDHKIVFYEKLSYNSQIIAVHEDITDEEQSIYIPKIRTSAKDAVTNDQIADATETVTIEDTVTYSNLVPGTKYEMRGTLMDKETGEPLKVDGKTVTAIQEFTPTTPNGTVVLTFTFNGINMTGKTIVAFEECYRDNKKLCVHTDINDESQTIRFPKLWSNAVFTDSGLKEGKAESTTRLTETFFYENLTPGVEYELVVVPMDYHAQAGIHVPMSGDGQVGVTHLEKRVLFTPESTTGEYTVEFEIDATILAGHTIVMFDTLYRDGKQVAQHQDWEDKEQTLKFVSIGTTLTNKETGDHLGQTIEKLELIDIVSYRNLIPGETYTVKGHLIDAETGETISEEVTVQFSPETENGIVEVPFTIDARELGGHRTVAYECLYRAESEIARHEDPNDDSQTVRFPEFSTVLHARDNVTLKEVQVSQAAMLTDTIKYTNLVPGYTYKMKGSLVERSSGKTLKDEHGDYIERELMFNPTDPDGEITMDFTFDSSDMAGQYVVAFQELLVVKTDADGNQTEVSLHEAKDLNDPNETIRFVDRPGDTPPPTPTPPPPTPTPPPPGDETPPPSDGPWVRTTALDKNTQTHMAEASENAVIVDTVKYGNLEVGKTYRMEGTLMDKATSKPVTDAQGNPLKSSTTFTPTDTRGTVEMSFTIDSTTMWGAHLVVFEKCFEITGTIDDDVSPSPSSTPNPSEKEVAKHEDINDEDQSIYVGRIRTVATVDGGNKATKPSKTTTVVDTVSYENLIPGVTYVMRGSLVDKSTQKAITLANGGTTVEQTFTPDKSSGTVALTFTFDSTGMQNASIVAVEYLYDRNGYLLTYHADMNDEDQTVFVNEEGVVPTIQTPDTGVDNNSPILAGTLAVLLAIAGIAAAGLLYKKKRRQNELF